MNISSQLNFLNLISTTLINFLYPPFMLIFYVFFNIQPLCYVIIEHSENNQLLSLIHKLLSFSHKVYWACSMSDGFYIIVIHHRVFCLWNYSINKRNRFLYFDRKAQGEREKCHNISNGESMTKSRQLYCLGYWDKKVSLYFLLLKL